MDIVVSGRHTTVSDRFRAHIEDKLAKVPTLAPRVERIDVLVSHESTRRQTSARDKVEITCRVKGKVIRAEARMDDKYAALDVALDKLVERLRRLGDRRRVSRGRHTPESVAQATSRLKAPTPELAEVDGLDDEPGGPFDGSPIEVRQKVHESVPMSLEEALQEMELVGHDFYLFHDCETDRPSVVYRRRGWSYGVLHLALRDAAPGEGGAAGSSAGGAPEGQVTTASRDRGVVPALS